MRIIKLLCLAFFFTFAAAGCGKSRNAMVASGTVEVRTADLSSQVSGRMVEMFFDEGATVKKGDVIAALDDRLLKARRESAEALFNQANDNYQSSRELLKGNAISREKYDQAKTAMINADSNLKQAQLMLDEAKITAPWNGILLKKYAEVGENVSAGSVLFSLGDMETAKVNIYVPLTETGLLDYGKKARVKVDSSTEWLEGSITYISDEAEFTPKNIQTRDERTKEVFRVEVTVANPGHILKPGMPADVEIK